MTPSKPDSEKSTQEILAERGSRYGKFKDHAEIVQAFINVFDQYADSVPIKADARQAVRVIFDKIARMINGDPEYIDNWQDIVGYGTLVLERMKADQLPVYDIPTPAQVAMEAQGLNPNYKPEDTIPFSLVAQALNAFSILDVYEKREFLKTLTEANPPTVAGANFWNYHIIR